MSEIQKINWKRGYRGKIAPDKAFNELEKIRKQNNSTLTAGLVVTKAKKPTNPLHKQFEWDNTVAADEHRMEQARRMIRSIVVVYKDAPAVAEQRHYVTTTEPAKRGNPARKVYRTTEETLKDPVARDELLGNAIRDAISYRRKYALLSELAEVFHALDDFVEHAKVI